MNNTINAPSSTNASRRNRAVKTTALVESSALYELHCQEQADSAWRDVVGTLYSWLQDPDQLADDGLDPPCEKVVRAAIRLADIFRESGDAAPDSVVPDPNGGVVFERDENGGSEVMHFWADGTLEYQVFQGTKIVERNCIQLFDND